MAEAIRPLDDTGRVALAVSADGLGILIRLLDREADDGMIAGLREVRAGELFADILPVGAGREDGEELQAALDILPDVPDTATLDDLAADFADCFLTHGYRLAPNGSVWMTEERLERQEPMFAVRKWYEHYDMSVPDWRTRADDHLVHELQFVHFLLSQGDAVAAHDAARFLDMHVLPWVPEFGRRMRERCNTRLLAATGGVLATYLVALRDLLADLTGVEPDIAPLPGDEPNPKAPDQELYIPGVEAGW
ncbi:TorD/DmsD family molecular chaperone [Tropicimonas sp.]|uniref:TorD/DmsD family molecular chaperone n=1 Tax=Tropicimonas sp. TaxID=2067044 RepID=UPI003A86FC99